MKPEVTDSEPRADVLAIDAIRDGDRERYRELVDRYAPKVFAIAWSRLGDRSLAEEAAQETFIAGYRRLSLLGHAERFGSWIATIARHTAINLGIRHRGELRRRERWALDQTPPDAPTPDSTTRDNLRSCLAELPPVHRECLVLFYLENRSIAEAARSLGISENACKVRLHRARAALRDAIELSLESKLETLRPPSGITRAVMLALPTQSPSLLAAGGILPALTKLLPVSGVLLLVQTLALLPGLLLASWLGKKELANFRDTDGFRARLYRQQHRQMLAGVFLLVMGFLLVKTLIGPNHHAAIFGGLIGLLGLDMARRSHVVRHPFQRLMTLAILVMSVALLGQGLLGWPPATLLLAQAGLFLLLSFTLGSLPPRMDFSLVLRAAQNLLPSTPAEPAAPTPQSIDPAQHLAFARFLGRLMLVDDWQRAPGALILRLTRVHPWGPASLIPGLRTGASRITLHADGRIEAVVGRADARALPTDPSTPTPRSLEEALKHALIMAWAAFRQGDTAAAARALGEAATDTIFLQPHAQTTTHRLRVWIMRTTAILLAIGGTLGWIDQRRSPELRQALKLEPTAAQESDVRAYLRGLDPASGPGHADRLANWDYGTHGNPPLPPRHLFTPAALAAVQSNAFSNLPLLDTPASRVETALHQPALMKAALGGLLNSVELRNAGLGPDAIRAGLAALPADRRARLTALDPVPFQGYPYDAIPAETVALRVQFLRQAGARDLLDLQPSVATLLSRQIDPAHYPSRAWPVADPAATAGLFILRDGSLLVETAEALTLLEAAQALDRIDRQRCIAAILRMHHRRGLFVAPAPAAMGPNGSRIRGEARDTWAAYQCLRRLDALDQVPDLPQWEFRPAYPAATTVRTRDGSLIPMIDAYQARWMTDLFQAELR